MSILKIATILAVTLSCALAQHGYAQYAHAPVHVVKEVYAHPKYAFQYGVHDAHTGDIKEQQESRDGDHVQGHYSLVEADGTRRIVHYTADDHNGFNAVVTKEGHAVHPVAVPVKHVQPVHYAHAPVAIAHTPIAVHSHQPAVAYSSVNLGHSQGYGQGLGHGYGIGQSRGLVVGQGVGISHGYSLGHGHGYGIGQSRGVVFGQGVGISHGYSLGHGHGYGIGQSRGVVLGQGVGISHGYSLGHGHGVGLGYGHGYGHY